MLIILYSGNSLFRYFWDFDVFDLVSCNAIVVGGFGVRFISLCMFGSDVFSDATFDVMNCVSKFVYEEFCGFRGGCMVWGM